MPITIDEIIIDAVSSSEIPKIHFDSFIDGSGSSDLLLVLRQNAQSVAVLNMSYAVARTLAQHLNDKIFISESRSGAILQNPMETDNPRNKKF